MIDPELLEVLRCPETLQVVRLAEPAVVDKLNAQIAAGSLQNRAAQPVREKLDGGLIRADGKLLYPVRRNIPVMLAGEGILLAG